MRPHTCSRSPISAKGRRLRKCQKNRNRPRNVCDSKIFRSKRNRYHCDTILSQYLSAKTRECGRRKYWEILPKDSCEVYKNRRRRREKREKQKRRGSDTSGSCSRDSKVSMQNQDRKGNYSVKIKRRKKSKTYETPSSSTYLASSRASMCSECATAASAVRHAAH